MGNCGCKGNTTAAVTTVATSGTGCSCGCSGNGCSACESRAFVRPRFFAGQLLTEDDLDLLGEYVVAKNRLHNRALWGPGVVCGLDVHCDPCGNSGTVVVEPGYAIDCCGDDIVVPCAESVDVLALVRELQTSSLGAACADPCSGSPMAIATTLKQASTAPVKSYYLYVRYAEHATDPVSPYATGEPCVGQSCEPTRIREGHRYELRATDDTPQFPGFYARATRCVGNLDQASAAAADSAVMSRNDKRLQAAQASLAQSPTPVFAAADTAALQSATTSLQTALAALTSQPATTQPAATAASSTADPTAVRAAVEATRVAGSLFARLVMTPAAQRPQIDTATTSNAQTQLASALKLVPPAVTAAGLRALETAEATTTLSLAKQFSTLANPPQSITYSEQLWALGAPLDDSLVGALSTAQSGIQAYIAGMPTKPTQANCLCSGQAIQPINAQSITQAFVAALVAALGSAIQAVEQLTFGCLCSALNPPCQRCDDRAVLLAQVRVQDCVVIDICELVRRFVITWPSLRYWTDIPGFALDIDQIGTTFEQVCCSATTGCVPATKPAQTIMGKSTELALLGSATASASPAFAKLAGLLPALQSASAPVIVPGGSQPAVDPALAQAIQAAVTAATASIQSELDALRAQVGQLSTAKRS